MKKMKSFGYAVNRDSFYKEVAERKEELALEEVNKMYKRVKESLPAREVQDCVTLGNKNYKVDYNDENYRIKLKQIIETLMESEYDWFKEERGFKHWVLYKKTQFEIKTVELPVFLTAHSYREDAGYRFYKVLHYKYTNKEPIELPLNCSSTSRMFMGCTLTKDIIFAKKTLYSENISTKNVIDMCYMFGGCRFSDHYVLSSVFDTSNAIEMEGLFSFSKLINGFKFPSVFNLRNVVNVNRMFATAMIGGLSLPDDFSFDSVICCNGMFSDANILKALNLPNDFKLLPVIADNMFSGLRIYENFWFPPGFSLERASYTRHMFYNSDFKKIVQITGKTNTDIVHQLSDFYDKSMKDKENPDIENEKELRRSEIIEDENREPHRFTIAERLSITAMGFTIIMFNNDEYRVDINNEESRKKFKDFVCNATGKLYEWFKETRGLKNWVLYRVDMFKVSSYLRYVCDNCDDEVELPLNCSSCYRMFYNLKSTRVVILDKKFDTTNVVDMSYMFSCADLSVFAPFTKYFNTENTKNMEGMFNRCNIPYTFKFSPKFITSNVENMSYMFYTCKVYFGFSLPETFDTTNVNSMFRMFSRTDLPANFKFPSKFIMTKCKDSNKMF